MKVTLADGSGKVMTYDEVCHALGFVPECHFVKLTNRGTVSFTIGKPDEIRALKNACLEAGFKMSKKLREF